MELLPASSPSSLPCGKDTRSAQGDGRAILTRFSRQLQRSSSQDVEIRRERRTSGAVNLYHWVVIQYHLAMSRENRPVSSACVYIQRSVARITSCNDLITLQGSHALSRVKSSWACGRPPDAGNVFFLMPVAPNFAPTIVYGYVLLARA